ncbi:hypothetical protein Bpfe_014241 [Biomphalaria pfeifferi]|uniref:Uncharacterized protein n=1 Tax=Biomphalaria pfeifferi TaxID=112525 RepID=A0AAD8BLH2_BIOPF|nr:hypothetical protein Bpfe_014241 [Biomphalaria pfeifferi]
MLYPDVYNVSCTEMIEHILQERTTLHGNGFENARDHNGHEDLSHTGTVGPKTKSYASGLCYKSRVFNTAPRSVET